MNLPVNLVTDRTQADVQERNAKGTYNASDINRVNDAVEEVAAAAVQMLTDLEAYRESMGVADDPIFQPYTAEDVVVNTPSSPWERQDIPYPAQMTQYLANITTLRGLLPITGPEVPADMVRLTFQEANAIEEILLLVSQAIQDFQANAEDQIDYIGTYANQLVSGTFYAGNYRTLQHFSRGR